MMNLALEMGDWGTWAGLVPAAGAILYTYIQHRQQKADQARTDALQREASEIASRQAEAAERRALALEQMVERLALAQSHPDARAETSEGKGSISWSCYREQKNLFVLRNEGDETATGVHVTVGDHPSGLTRRLPENAVVRAHESVEFLIIGAWGHSVPREVRVSWAGQDEPVVVPIRGI
ncbi:hypothetical protein [Streptomyces sp. SID8016]|uniref:hypothetical protein n=1 Tax=Streptomyces sp. SID8016 TaxID=2706098 RepID=UPI0013DAE828|nr:hypothetical protein [Streptomyces sp. SID8016]